MSDQFTPSPLAQAASFIEKLERASNLLGAAQNEMADFAEQASPDKHLKAGAIVGEIRAIRAALNISLMAHKKSYAFATAMTEIRRAKSDGEGYGG